MTAGQGSGDEGNPLTGLVSRSIRSALLGARTCLPGRVLKVYPSKQAIDVQPLIQAVVRVDGEDQERSLPVITMVPVQMPRWAGYVFRMFPAVDDVVTLQVSDRELERWLAGDGSPVAPRSGRTHSLDDAIAGPGIAPWAQAAAGLESAELVIGREDGSGQVRIARNGGVFVGPADGDSAVAREGDEVTIDVSSDASFMAWLGGLSPSSVAPYTSPIKGRITTGFDGD